MDGFERDWLPQPSEDDIALWGEVMRGVRPLRGRALPNMAASLPRREDRAAPEAAGPDVQARKRAGPKREASLAERGLTGLDARRAERLRRGEIAIEARLDLHGMSQEAAHRALDRFLSTSVTAGRRCVLVITGKGSPRAEPTPSGHRFHFDSAKGVLRSRLPHWIEQGPHRDRIVAVQPAHRKHGGEGAFYIYLRRPR